MSKKKKNQNDETSGQSRRDFIRNAALGAAGITLGLSLTKAERALAKFAKRHADDFFAKASGTIPNRADETAFTQLFNEVSSMVESNPQLRLNLNSIFDTLTSNAGPLNFTHPITSLGLHTDTTNLLATGYLGGLSSLRTQVPTREQISNILSNPSSVNRFIEAGFVNSLYRSANQEVVSNPEFARNVGSAVSQIERAAPPNGEPCTVPTYVNGQYVGETPCWVVVVVVVIIIIVIVLK
jgi:hypothetical protein